MRKKITVNHKFTCPQCGKTFNIDESKRLKEVGKDIGESVRKTAINVSLRVAGLGVGSCFSLMGRNYASKGFKAGGKLAKKLGYNLGTLNCNKLYVNCKYCGHKFLAIL